MSSTVDAALALHNADSLLHTAMKRCTVSRCERDFLLNTVIPTAHRILLDHESLTMHQLAQQVNLVDSAQLALEALPFCDASCPPLSIPDSFFQWIEGVKDGPPKLVCHSAVQTDLSHDEVLSTSDAVRALKRHQILPIEYVRPAEVNPFPFAYSTPRANDQPSDFFHSAPSAELDDYFDYEEEDENMNDASTTAPPTPVKSTSLARKGSAVVDISSILLKTATTSNVTFERPNTPSLAAAVDAPPRTPARIKLIVKEGSPDTRFTHHASAVGPIRTKKIVHKAGEMCDRLADVPVDERGEPLLPVWQLCFAVLKEAGDGSKLVFSEIQSLILDRFPCGIPSFS